MNTPLIIFSLSCDVTAGSNSSVIWVALNSGYVVLMYRLPVALVCG